MSWNTVVPACTESTIEQIRTLEGVSVENFNDNNKKFISSEHSEENVYSSLKNPRKIWSQERTKTKDLFCLCLNNQIVEESRHSLWQCKFSQKYNFPFEKFRWKIFNQPLSTCFCPGLVKGVHFTLLQFPLESYVSDKVSERVELGPGLGWTKPEARQNEHGLGPALNGLKLTQMLFGPLQIFTLAWFQGFIKKGFYSSTCNISPS